ncbi:MAG: hypothetical protein D6761_13810 [Candidatus Dadabacteria bacterium]|nr:MAG: hypothetical protein D6761_13810 [Candidatus Dadabacteria bacterium]
MSFRLTGPGQLVAIDGQRRFGALFGGVGLLTAVGAGVAATHGAPGHALAILAAFAVVFLLAGSTLAFQYRRLTLRGEQLLLTERQLWQVTTARAGRDALRAVRVEAVVAQSSSNGGSRTLYEVVLEIRAPGFPERFVAARYDSESRALQEAAGLARNLGLPLFDAIGDEPVEIDPHTLRPVAWQDDETPQAKPVHIEVRGSLPSDRVPWMAGITALLLTDVPLVVGLLHIYTDLEPHILALIGALVALPSLLFGLWLLLRTNLVEAVTAHDGVIEVQARLGRRTIQHRTIRPADIQRIRAHAEKTASGRGLLIQTDRGQIWTLRGADADTLHQVATELSTYVDAQGGVSSH